MPQYIIAIVLTVFLAAGCSSAQRKSKPLPDQKIPDAAYSSPYRAQNYFYEHDRASDESNDRAGAPAPDKLTIRQIQKALKNAGYYKGAADGKMGPQTKEAVKKFQKANGLRVDGIVGKQTTRKLKGYL